MIVWITHSKMNKVPAVFLCINRLKMADSAEMYTSNSAGWVVDEIFQYPPVVSFFRFGKDEQLIRKEYSLTISQDITFNICSTN